MSERVKKSTMVELVEELLKLPQTPEMQLMVAEAKVGEFHDYKNEKYACGKVESSQRLRSLGHPELARRIEQGEFDEEPDAADIAEMKKTLSPAAWAAFGLDGPA